MIIVLVEGTEDEGQKKEMKTVDQDSQILQEWVVEGIWEVAKEKEESELTWVGK